MWVLIKDSMVEMIGEDTTVWGFDDYDAAFKRMEEEIAHMAEVFGVADDEEEYGADYDDGRGFVGIGGGYIYVIEEVVEE